MPGIYDHQGVKFLYPDNWTLAGQSLDTEPIVVELQSPSSAFWTLHVYTLDNDAGEIIDEFRDAMAADRGMLFIYDANQPQAFWMKNTKIPLDILYFDGSRKLVSQQRDVPPCSLGDGCPSYPSKAPAQYVLELNAGEAARLELQDGAELTFGPGIPPGK